MNKNINDAEKAILMSLRNGPMTRRELCRDNGYKGRNTFYKGRWAKAFLLLEQDGRIRKIYCNGLLKYFLAKDFNKLKSKMIKESKKLSRNKRIKIDNAKKCLIDLFLTNGPTTLKEITAFIGYKHYESRYIIKSTIWGRAIKELMTEEIVSVKRNSKNNSVYFLLQTKEEIEKKRILDQVYDLFVAKAMNELKKNPVYSTKMRAIRLAIEHLEL